MNLITPFWEDNIVEETAVDSSVSTPMADNVIGVDFSFFNSDAAKNIDAGPVSDKPKKKSSKVKVAIDGEPLPSREVAPAAPGAIVAEVDYARTYTETNNLIRGAIMQTDELSAEIKSDIDAVRSSKTLKNKYTYITNLTASASALLSTKISAIKELNSVITQGHNLELNRMKTLKLNEADGNDDMKMMDLYSAFINTPIGAYTPSTPSIQDLTLGVNAPNPNVSAVEMTAPMQGGALSPEQNRMRMEADPNVQVVVRYSQTTGQRAFDVIDRTTGVSIPNYPRPDSFLLEDTTIDIHTGIARNRNINTVWPLVMDGSAPIAEY